MKEEVERNRYGRENMGKTRRKPVFHFVFSSPPLYGVANMGGKTSILVSMSKHWILDADGIRIYQEKEGEERKRQEKERGRK